MQQSNDPRGQPRTGTALAIAAALLCATALSQPNLAYAGPHGGGGRFGGFHGVGFAGSHYAGSTGNGFMMAGSTTIVFAIAGFSLEDPPPIRGGAITRKAQSPPPPALSGGLVAP
jgi:hypothetical protein